MEGGYDTDSISVTSTQSSEFLGTYDCEDILAEDDVAGDIRYLIKWEGYPLHRATWEPPEHIEGTELLPRLEARKRLQGEAAFQRSNYRQIIAFENACNNEQNSKIERKKKRAKKRQKERDRRLARIDTRNSRQIVDSGSETEQRPARQTIQAKPTQDQPIIIVASNEDEEDDALPALRKETGNTRPKSQEEGDDANSLFVTDNRAPHKGPLQQSSGSSSEEDLPLKERKEKAKKQKLAEHLKGLGVTNSNPQGQELQKTQTSHKQLTVRHPSDEQGNQEKRQQSSIAERPASASSSSRRPVTGSVTLKLGPRKTQTAKEKPQEGITDTETAGDKRQEVVPDTEVENAPIASIEKSRPEPTVGPIKLVNQPKMAAKKTRQHGDNLYKKVSFRWAAEKRGRVERTPAPTSLEFVGGTPSGVRSEARREISRAPRDNPYSRRETGRIREVEEVNQPGEDLHENLDWERNKIPLTCYEWRMSNNCVFPPEKCHFLHRHTPNLAPADGKIPGKYRTPPVTCWHWMRDPVGCRKSSDECLFTHRNTGVLATIGQGLVEIDVSEPPMSIVQGELDAHVSGSGPATQGPRPPVPRPWVDPHSMTCYFWNRGHCDKPDSVCKFQHRVTGMVAGPPGTKRFSIQESERDQSFNALSAETKQHYEQGAPIDDASLDNTHDYDMSGTDEPDQTQVPRTAAADQVPMEKLQQLNLKTTSPSIGTTDPKYSKEELDKAIESACKLDYARIFEHPDEPGAMLDRRAFLIFHPDDHHEELELISRWLLMHHVEVYTFLKDGAWEYFKKLIVEGGTGVILVHPEFYKFFDIPGFGKILRHKIRVWSIGYQMASEYDHNVSTVFVPPRYDCIEIFPHGGLIYITDEVFNENPIEALKLISHFVGKVDRCREVDSDCIDPTKLVDDGCLLWRLVVRPDFMETLYQWCEDHAAQVEARDPIDEAAQSRAKLYDLLSRCEYIEQDTPASGLMLPDDYFPIISNRGEIKDPYYKALRRSQTDANVYQIQLYVETLIDLKRDYRQFFVVHTEPQKVDWQRRWQNIDGVMSPKKCIEYLSRPEARGNRIEFYTWAFPEKSKDGLQGPAS